MRLAFIFLVTFAALACAAPPQSTLPAAKAPPQSTLKNPLCPCKACGCDGCDCRGGKCLCPACMASESDYNEARERAIRQGRFLVTYVGIDPPSVADRPQLVAYTPKLDGFEAGDVVISGPWIDGRHVWYATLHRPGWYSVTGAVQKAQQELREAQKPRAALPIQSPTVCTT